MIKRLIVGAMALGFFALGQSALAQTAPQYTGTNGSVINAQAMVCPAADGIHTTPCPGSSSSSPTYTTSTSGSGVTGQVKISVTGTAVQFNAGVTNLINGLTYCAATTNTAPMTVGWSSSLNSTADGTGNGEVLQPGQCGAKASVSPTSLYANGTAGNWLSYGGN
jgi:hypothetical protein